MKKKTNTEPAVLTGKIHVGKLIGGGEEPVMRIDIQDDSSGVHFCEVRLSLKAMMDALTGAFSECTFELRGVELVGMRHEHKSENVPLDMYAHSVDRRDRRDRSVRSPAVEAALKPFEVDGWRGSADDLFNSHNSVKGKERVQRVGFHRYVNPATGKPVTLT